MEDMLIPLTQGRYTVVDAADYPQLIQVRWHVIRCTPNNWYAARSINGHPIYMHRVILNAPDNIQVDHVSGDGLDNRRANLRLATAMQNHGNMRRNRMNTSGYIGVSWNTEERKWYASIYDGPRRIHLGRFRTAEDAARARDIAAHARYGSFARLNFPDHVESF